MNIYIIAGQSNALGISPICELDEKIIINNNTLIYQASNVKIPFSNQLIKVKLGLGADETKFGLEVGVAQQLQKYENNSTIIKYASDGTSLFDRWRATEVLGEDFINLISTINAAIKKLKSLKMTVNIKGFIWMQGENDACFLEQANEYQKNLINFICSIRHIFDCELPFVIGQTNPNNKILKYVDTVNFAQKNVAKELNNVFFVATDDINELIDNYHYSAKSEVELGKRMMEALLK